MKLRKPLAAVLTVFVLVSCAPVKYQRKVPGWNVGYEEEQFGLRTFEVRTSSRWPGALPDLEKFVLYRAAELTLEQGFRYFAVLEEDRSGLSIYSPWTPPIGGRSGLDYSIYSPSAPPNPVASAGTVADTDKTPGLIDVARTRYLWTTPTRDIYVHRIRVKLRLLVASEIAAHKYVVEAQKVIDGLKPFIDRRR